MKQKKQPDTSNTNTSTTPDANQVVATVQSPTISTPDMCLHCHVKRARYDGYCSTPCMHSAFALSWLNS